MQIDQYAPDWQADALPGEVAPAVADFRGRPLLILFFSRGCPACLGRAIPFSLALLEQYPELAIVGIHTHFEGSPYSPAQVAEVKALYRLPYPVLIDRNGQSYRSFGAEGTPHWILIRPDGRVFKSIFGSMDNARQRLEYALMELLEEGAGKV